MRWPPKSEPLADGDPPCLSEDAPRPVSAGVSVPATTTPRRPNSNQVGGGRGWSRMRQVITRSPFGPSCSSNFSKYCE